MPEHQFLFGPFRTWKTVRPLFTFQTSCCSRRFSKETTRKAVFHVLFNRVFRKHFINGEQHLFPREETEILKDKQRPLLNE